MRRYLAALLLAVSCGGSTEPKWSEVWIASTFAGRTLPTHVLKIGSQYEARLIYGELRMEGGRFTDSTVTHTLRPDVPTLVIHDVDRGTVVREGGNLRFTTETGGVYDVTAYPDSLVAETNLGVVVYKRP